MYQEFARINLNKSGFKSVNIPVFEKPIKFAFFEWIIRVCGKSIFWAEVAQVCAGGIVMHKKASLLLNK
jgi:hypothetical protein